jgi:GxxExxY protein
MDSAYRIHTALGPGLLESAYESCLAYDLVERGLSVRTQVPIPLVYKGLRVHSAYRADLIVEDGVIIEVKAVTNMLSLFDAQLLSYLKLTGLRVGLLINFHSVHLKDGIKRKVNNF